LNTRFRPWLQPWRIDAKYASSESTRCRKPTFSASRLISATSSGSPTDRLERIVESKDTSAHFIASSSVVAGLITRSMIGLPYLLSPIWKNAVSSVASMKLPSG
jgi:hypothetical protein